VKLYLIRHGEAVYGDTDDINRQLTERGEQHAQNAALWLSKTVKGPVSLWASPYLRTQQTAAPIAKALNIEVTSHNCLKPEMTAQKVVDELAKEEQSIILVTHLPLVGRLASLLIDGVVFDQPWSPTEIWQLEGDVFAAGCLVSTDVWYPALEEG
jgi:phosphohistidine phosphatase